jgi:hypothetical protein
MIKHVVFFKFKPDISAAEREAAISGLRGLPDKIDLIRAFELGEDVLRLPRSWDVVLIATFDDLDALQTYATHPDHVPVAELLKALCTDVGSVDYVS